MKYFPNFHRGPVRAGRASTVIPWHALPAVTMAIGVFGISLAGWQALAALPRWMQDVIGSSAIEAALYRVMEIPGVKPLYPRPPKEAQSELSRLIGKAPDQAELYQLRDQARHRSAGQPGAAGQIRAGQTRSLGQKPQGELEIVAPNGRVICASRQGLRAGIFHPLLLLRQSAA